MQINIDKKTGVFLGIIIVLLAVIMSMGMSRNSDRGLFGMNHSEMMDSDESRTTMNLTGADVI